jgi:uncharacterized radical SAM superfamily Fe-S cluster-containing enzyme
MPSFELYLQFDFRETLVELRGADRAAFAPTGAGTAQHAGCFDTLVVTVKRLNEGELGRIIVYALQQPCVRGVTFQPVQVADA